MKTTIDISTKLTRHSDTGNVSTSFSYVEGMPPMLVIKQKKESGSTQVIELTMPEANVLQYVLGEIRSIVGIVERMDDSADESRADESRAAGLTLGFPR